MGDLIRLVFIRHAKELLTLCVDTISNGEEVRTRIEAKIFDIEQKIIP